MTPEQALQVLVQLAELAPVPKRDHVAAEQAAGVLQPLVAAAAKAEDNPAANPARSKRPAAKPDG